MSVKSYIENGKKKYYCSVRYTDYAGKRIQHKKQGFNKSSEAKEYEKEFLERIAGSSDMCFKSLCNLYLKDCKTRMRATTYRGKEYFFKTHLIDFFENKPINDISPAMVRDWQNTLLSHVPQYSQTYLKTCNNQLSACFNFAVKYYGLRSNPVRIAGSIGKSHAGRLDFWTVSEYKQFMKSLNANKAVTMSFELLFYTGMRIGELTALTLADFDATNGTIDINKTLSMINGENIVTPPKTPKSKRIVTLPPKVSKHLHDYIDSMYEPQPSERLFPTINKARLGEILKKTAAAASVKAIRIHDIRHSHASLLIELGFPPLLISERLGHEKIETTLQIYSHLYPNKAADVAKKLNKIV